MREAAASCRGRGAASEAKDAIEPAVFPANRAGAVVRPRRAVARPAGEPGRAGSSPSRPGCGAPSPPPWTRDRLVGSSIVDRPSDEEAEREDWGKTIVAAALVLRAAQLSLFYELGVDGLFTDNPDTRVTTRTKVFDR
jgi:hypothetical protein